MKVLVAEIVGPAGAGKSALARALRERDAAMRAGLGVWGLPRRLLALSAFASLPNFFRANGNGRRLSWGEVALVARLNALQQFLRQEASRDRNAFVLDEGVVFALAKLRTFSNARGHANGFDGPTQKLLGRWAETLDAIIWLDAPDPVLTRRIRERGKPHRMKGKTDREIHEFLARYRAAYEQVVAALAARRAPSVIRYDTERESPGEIADKVLAGMREGSGSAWQQSA